MSGLRPLFVATLLCCSGLAYGELVIVSSQAGAIAQLDRAQAERLYLGRTTALSDNTPVALLDLPPGIHRDRFYRLLTGKNPVQIRAYWSRQVFTGRALPPREAASEEQLREWLSANPNALGYLPEESVSPGVRILLRLSE